MSKDNYQPLATGSPAEWNETLLKMARFDIYRVNAFRILNLPVTASPKEISSRVRQLDLMEKYGNVDQYDSGFLPLVPKPDSDARREAQQRLLDPELRFIDEFFWFWPVSPGSVADSDDAFIAMNQNDLSRALSIWERREVEGSMTNVSMHNIAVLYHAQALDVERIEAEEQMVSKQQQLDQKRFYWQQAWSRWQTLLNDEGFWQRVRDRIRELDDPRLTIGTARRIRDGLPTALISINAKLAVEAAEMDDPTDALYHLSLMQQSGFDSAIIDEALRQAVIPVRDRIRDICTHASEDTGNLSEHDREVAENLIMGHHASLKLEILDLLLPEGNAMRNSAHDEVALQARSCLISFCNKTENWRTTLELMERAAGIAASRPVRECLEEDIETIRGNMEHYTCWFCKKAPADQGSAVEVKLHGNVQRERGWTGTQVEWQKLNVPVPRCKECKSAHDRVRNLGCAGPIVGAILAIVVGLVAGNALAGFIVFAVFGIGGYLTARLTCPEGMKQASHGKEFRRVKELRAQGWEIGEKPEGVQ